MRPSDRDASYLAGLWNAESDGLVFPTPSHLSLGAQLAGLDVSQSSDMAA